MKIWKNYFDIVILPPREISDYARELSKGLARYGTKWKLGKKSFIPHISLYHIAVKPKSFDDFIVEIQHTMSNFSPGYVKTTVIKPHMLMFDKPLWIQKLHRKVIKKTIKYVDWGYPNHWPPRRGKVRARSIKKYGTPLVGAHFRPHVTLASFSGDTPKLPIKKARVFKFKPTHIYVCELGPSHSCQRVVEKIFFPRSPNV